MGEGVIGFGVGGRKSQRAHHYNNLPDSYATTEEEKAAASCIYMTSNVPLCGVVVSFEATPTPLPMLLFPPHPGPRSNTFTRARTRMHFVTSPNKLKKDVCLFFKRVYSQFDLTEHNTS